jgi:hypothetical protein
MEAIPGENAVNPELTTAQLRRSLRKFANNLSGGSWNKNTTQKVEITRTIVEKLPINRQDDDRDLPFYKSIKGSFEASKREFDTESGSYMEPMFIISGLTTRHVKIHEIPLPVVIDMFDMSEDESEELHTYCLSNQLDTYDKFVESLETVELTIAEEVTYVIDSKGRIEEYHESFAYGIDETTMYLTEYPEQVGEYEEEDTTVEEPYREQKPKSLALLNEFNVESESSDTSIQADYDEFTKQQDFERIAQELEVTNKEHTRRAMAIIAMVSDGFVELDKLKRS